MYSGAIIISYDFGAHRRLPGRKKELIYDFYVTIGSPLEALDLRFALKLPSGACGGRGHLALFRLDCTRKP